MRQTLKIGITVLVVAAMAMSGIALAQTSDESDEAAENAVTRIGELIAPLVDDGTLTQAQADTVAEFLAENGPRRGPGRHHRGPGPEAIAEFLGVTTDELRAAKEAGQTLAEVADANGSSADALVDFLVANATERLEEKVASGEITQDEADEKLAEITERVTDMVNGEFEGRPGGRGPGGPGGGGGDTTDA